jgi:hypothetical protein
MKYKIGDKVALNELTLSIGYITCRSDYTNVFVGKKGRVIGYAATGKVAVEFDYPIFIHQNVRISSHNNGCHGKGKINHCWYFPESALDIVKKNKKILLCK